MELQAKIEGLLFYKGEPMQIKKLAELLNANQEEIESAILLLSEALASRGITLIRKEDSVTLGVAKDLSELVEAIRKDEITKDLSKATLETLSIILYKNGTTRSEIDYIRGVNSSFILRNLLIRGLIEKREDKNDGRRIVYVPTFDALSFMGINNIEELPNYKEVIAELDGVINNKKETTNE